MLSFKNQLTLRARLGQPTITALSSRIYQGKIQKDVIDKKHGVLITDEGLANLLHIEVKRANEKANDIKIQRIVCDTQAIDLNGDLKKFQGIGSITQGTDDHRKQLI